MKTGPPPLRGVLRPATRLDPIDLSKLLVIGPPRDDSPFAMPPFRIRTREPIEDDPLIRACTLTFMSGFGPVPVAHPPGTPLSAHADFAASLDHAVWFHRPFVAENWHRYEVKS